MRMTRLFVVIFFVPFFLLTLLARANSGCTLSAPTTAISGQFFTITWSLSASSSVKLVRSDGIGVATSTGKSGSAVVWATSVLGDHTYTLKYGSTVLCFATVKFVYTPDVVDGYDIVIIAGQSNATGYGQGPFSDPLQNSVLDQKIVQVGRIDDSNMQIVPVGYWQNGVESDGLQHWGRKEGTPYEGFGLTFGRNYVQKSLASGRKLLLVPVAYSGTSVRQWINDSPTINFPLYADMLTRTQFALNQGGNNRIVAIIWDQVETDMLDTVNGSKIMNPTIYQQDLTILFSMLRRDFGATVPILAVSAAPYFLSDSQAHLILKAQFNQAIIAVTQAMPPAANIATSGLLTNPEIGLGETPAPHFTAASQVVLGNRLWGALKKIQ